MRDTEWHALKTCTYQCKILNEDEFETREGTIFCYYWVWIQKVSFSNIDELELI